MSAVARKLIGTGVAGVIVGLVVLATLPFGGAASPTAVDALLGAQTSLETLTPAASAPRESLSAKLERLRLERLEQARKLAALAAPRAGQAQQAEDPKTQPPLHGTNPHGEGTVGVVDVQPDPTRPQGGNPDGSDRGEEVVVGRARGEQREDGTYHGHITIVALFGNEVLGVDTDPGETEGGPLSPVQQGILDPVCNGSGNQVCVSAVTADSSTDGNGSTNRFSAAHVTVGGANGIDAGAAESNGNISSDGTCQTSHGDSSVANVRVGGQAVADAAQSSSDSKACKGQAPTQSNSSTVTALGGTGVPLPAAGCADGTPDVVTGIPTVAPVVCNADDSNTDQGPNPYGTRDALSVYALDAGGNSALKTTTGASESLAKAPPPQCSDKVDNDGDGKVDATDPGCLSGPGGAYNPNDDNEADEAVAAKPQCSDAVDNDGDGKVDATDPGCLSGPGGAYDPNDNDETDPAKKAASKPECSDDRDNDGDGRIDSRDPGCLSGPGGSYNPRDDDESGGGAVAECSDERDNDGDGRTDARDPGCLSGPGGSYNPRDDDESDNGGPAACADGVDNDGDGVSDRDDPGCLSGPGGTYNPNDDDESDRLTELAFTGLDALGLAIAGLLLLAGGLALRRRTAVGPLTA